jgi:hypothetical protein
MNQVLDHEFQSLAAEAICHEARMAGAAIQEAAGMHQRPSAVFRPSLSIDGNQWCALYGANLQDGVAGFGDSPTDAMWDFDRNWSAKLPSKAASPALDAMMGRADWPSVVAG